MLREDDGTLALALARSREGEDLEKDSVELSRSVVLKVSETKEPVFISDVQEENNFKDQKSIVDLNIKTVIGIPLVYQDNVVGVIYADSDHVSGRFSPSDLSIMRAFGSQAAVAIENARRHGELESIRTSLEKQNVKLREALEERYEFSGMIGRSPEMQKIFEVIKKVARFSTTGARMGNKSADVDWITQQWHAQPGTDRVEVGGESGDLTRDNSLGRRR